MFHELFCNPHNIIWSKIFKVVCINDEWKLHYSLHNCQHSEYTLLVNMFIDNFHLASEYTTNCFRPNSVAKTYHLRCKITSQFSLNYAGIHSAKFCTINLTYTKSCQYISYRYFLDNVLSSDFSRFFLGSHPYKPFTKML